MKTVAIPLFKCNLEGDNLMAIKAGIPANDAIDMASLFLDSVVGLLDGLSDDERTHVTESAFYLAKLAKAAIDAVGGRHE